MQKNILITFINAIDPTSGGVERVYHNLVPFFIRNGYNVYALYRKKSDYDSKSVYTKIFFVKEEKYFKLYKKKIDQIISAYNIEIVICPFTSYQLFDKLSRLNHIKVFFHVHNVPSKYMLPRPKFFPKFLENTRMSNWIKILRRNIVYKSSFKRIESNNMKIVLLSEKFRDDMNKVWNFKDSNIICLPNPFILDENFDIKKQKKDKIVLYVGRLAEIQKRIHSLLNIWKNVQDRLPDYRLDIVGGGPEKSKFESMAKDLELKRVTFYGFQNPEMFYKRSSCFCMTSNYEGFGMVLVEAMQYGCVPFAFNSFASLTDIINNETNGFIIESFDENKYSDKLVEFLSMTEEEQMRIKVNSINKTKEFSVEKVGNNWLNIINNY